MRIDLVCLDADDTLWHNMRHFDAAERALFDILGPFASPDIVRARLQKVGARNLAHYGYGAKSFILSMVETASELCGGCLPTSAISKILSVGRELLSHPVELLPGVEEVLATLKDRAKLVLVTKGDLLHQESKLAASGLGDYFSAVEIMSDKTADSFRRVLARHGSRPERCVMAGDSIRSDVLPALAVGAWAAHVPHEIVWFYERADPPLDHPRFRRLETLIQLPEWINVIESD